MHIQINYLECGRLFGICIIAIFSLMLIFIEKNQTDLIEFEKYNQDKKLDLALSPDKSTREILGLQINSPENICLSDDTSMIIPQNEAINEEHNYINLQNLDYSISSPNSICPLDEIRDLNIGSTKEKKASTPVNSTGKHIDYERDETEIDSLEKIKYAVKPKPITIKTKIKVPKNTKKGRERYEVIYRSILRKFRKYFNTEFDKTTKYKSIKRYRKNDFFIECVSQYARQTFEDHYSENLVYSLGYLIYPAILIKNIKELKTKYSGLELFLKHQEETKLQINDILYDFTFAKMKLLFQNKEYKFFFNYYAQHNEHSFKDDELCAAKEMIELGR